MNCGINKQMFLFDESTEVKLKLQLFYKERGVRMSAVIDAAIKYKDGSLTLYAEEPLTSRNLDKGLGIYFMKNFGKSDYKVKEANVGGQAIKLKIGEKLLFNNSYLEKGKRVFSMELNHIVYSYEGTGHPTCYRLTIVSSSLVSPYLTGLTLSGNIVVGTQPTEYSGRCFNSRISLFRDERYVYLETEDNITDILSVLSFFFWPFLIPLIVPSFNVPYEEYYQKSTLTSILIILDDVIVHGPDSRRHEISVHDSDAYYPAGIAP